jgi:hypothetical protein
VKHYFLDFVGRGRSELDFTGRILAAPEIAYDFAELMALDLGGGREEETIGWAVNVSSIEGRTLFSIPVRTSYLAAA